MAMISKGFFSEDIVREEIEEGSETSDICP